MSVATAQIAAKVRETFNFSVDKFSLRGPEPSMKTPWYAMFRSDTGEAVGTGSVSARYVPHETDDVVALVEAAESAFGEVADVACGFRNGHYVSITPTKQQRLAVFGDRDAVVPRVLIHAPYGSTFNATIGMYRDVCRNLAVLREVKATTVRIRHTHNLRPRMDQLIEDFSLLATGWRALTDRLHQMEQVSLNVADFLDGLYGQPKRESPRALTVHKNRTEAIIRRLARERVTVGRELGDLRTATGYELFQAVQGYAQWDLKRKGKPSPFERIILASTDNTVRQAERLAIGMAV
jgi:hypothetical protein